MYFNIQGICDFLFSNINITASVPTLWTEPMQRCTPVYDPKT